MLIYWFIADGVGEMEELKTIGGLAQLGSFGLLCAIAFWLMKNIPKHLEALKAERIAVQDTAFKIAEEHNKSNLAIAVEHKAVIKELIAQSAEQVKYERDECDKRHQEVVSIMNKCYETIRQMKHEVANIAQARALEKAAREMQAKKQGT